MPLALKSMFIFGSCGATAGRNLNSGQFPAQYAFFTIAIALSDSQVNHDAPIYTCRFLSVPFHSTFYPSHVNSPCFYCFFYFHYLDIEESTG